MNIEDYNLFQKCIDRWGNESQILMTIEELNELGVVLCHVMRENKPHDRENIIEEIADVRLMLDQLQYLFEISNAELSDMRNKKIQRLQKLLEIEKQTDKFLDKNGGNIFG